MYVIDAEFDCNQRSRTWRISADWPPHVSPVR